MMTVQQEILDRIIQSEIGQKVQADIDREAMQQRIDLKCQVEKLKRERSESISRLKADIEITATELERARVVMQQAEQAHRLAQQKMAHSDASYTSRIQSMERRLMNSASESISNFIRWLSDQQSECTSMKVNRRGQQTGKFRVDTGTPICDWYSTSKSQQARLKAIQAAKAEAEALRMLVLDDAEVESRLDVLRDSLPDIVMELEGTR